MNDTPDRQETAPRDLPPLGHEHPQHEHLQRVLTWRTVANSAAYLVPYLKPGLTLLDVMCGPGTVTVDLARRLAPGRVYGLDASATAVEQAAGLAFDEGVGNASFVVGDVYALPVADASVDIVHAHQVLQLVDDPVAAVREMRRVLKPGGILAARDADYGAAAWYPKLPALAAWMAVYRALHSASGGDPDAGRALKAWARQAGFAEVTSSASIWCFASAAEREWWGESWAQRATEADFAARAIEAGVARLADLHEISAAWRQWALDPDGWFVLAHGEIIAVR
ncbi:methyltransferase domain-containing protein [Cryobacterium sp. SO2]|uniref:class I SAM-dependent methyltransferase n=1 Tax=Cryobacterium sp. SO2 TaxID=1897060 RepID=UPI00223D56E8|nr:methyltransferase domain-containing protein [Cryobacterium sp. SO2]WEO75815.1 methyltransferase domain-containing protein [Cryobacterium sp. SO2]